MQRARRGPFAICKEFGVGRAFARFHKILIWRDLTRGATGWHAIRSYAFKQVKLSSRTIKLRATP